MNKRQQIVHTLSRNFTRGDIQGATDELLSLLDVTQWVAVEDRLPEKGAFCLTYGENGHTLQYYKGHWETEYPVKEDKVTHWQLAKPPCG